MQLEGTGMRFPWSRRASVVVTGHNEGDLLSKTVQSCLETAEGLDLEVVVANDASTDGSVEKVVQCFPKVRVASFRKRHGTSPAKDLGARRARGDVLIFLDGHCKPEPWAIERLVNNVEDLDGEAIVMPRVPALDCNRWENNPLQVGHGYRMTLDGFECSWIGLEEMETRDRLYESPALIGCCFAMSRMLYRKLWGFDGVMMHWGVEDIDLGLKAWLMGHPVLHNPFAAIGHRFRSTFDTFFVADEAVLFNQMRMARKNFTEAVWCQWLERARPRHESRVWDAAWSHFSRNLRSVERERAYLMGRRARDEFSYARKFSLDWPVS
jgi:GT2 family glycosyltransferase